MQSGFQQPRVTKTVKALIFTLVGAYFLQMSLETFAGIDLSPLLGFRVSSFILQFHLWQALTYAFLHGGAFHLIFNVLVFYMMAGDLEAFWGRKSFLQFCAITVVAGPILQTLVWLGAALIHPDWMNSALFMRPTIGASGAVYGIMAAYGVLFGEATILAFFVFPMKMRIFIGALVVYEMGMGLFSTDGVSHLFHLGGMLAGYWLIKWKGPGLRGGGGGGGGLRFFKPKMSRDEVRKRLRIVSNDLPQKNDKGDRGLPITWN